MNQKDVEDIISSRENITSMLINAYNNEDAYIIGDLQF